MTTENQIRFEHEELRKTLQIALMFIADLNGSEWIKGDGTGETDIKQRATNLQKRLYNTLEETTHEQEQAKSGTELMGKIPFIMENFSFERVHAYMLLTKWKWTTGDADIMETPSIEQLKAKAEQMLTMAALHGHRNCGTGGFTAYTFPYGIKLSFEPFNYSSF